MCTTAIPPWLWGSHLTFEDLLAGSRDRSVPGGGTLPCASPADNLLVSALHIVSDKNSPGSTLMAWRDVLVLARAADPDELLVRARLAHLCGWLAWILDALPPGTVPAGLHRQLAAEDRRIPYHRRLRLVMPPGVAARHMVLSQMCRLPPSNAARYLIGLGWPSPDFLDARIGSAPHPRMAWIRTTVAGSDHLDR